MTHQPTDHGPGHRPREHAAGHLPRFRGGGENTGVNAAREPQAARQRWKLVVVIAIVAALVLAILIMHLTGANPMKGSGF